MNNYFQLLFTALIYILVIIPLKAEEITAHKDFKEIPVGHFNRLVESVVSDEEFVLLETQLQTIVKGKEWSGWKQNYINLKGDVSTAVLNFTDSLINNGVSAEGRTPSFSIELDLEDIRSSNSLFAKRDDEISIISSGAESFRMTLRHSKASAQNEMKGIRLAVSEKSASRIFYNGLDQTGIAVFIPKIPRTGYSSIGALLCPRNFDVWKAKGGQRKLENSNYSLESASFKAKGMAQARVASGLGPGHAKAIIQTSLTLAPSKFVVDESFSAYPYASLEYLAKDEVLAPALMSSKAGITAGIMLKTIHHNSFKHKTDTMVESVMTLRNVEVKKPLRFGYLDKVYNIEPGTCVALIKETFNYQEHMKYELPKQSLQKPEPAPSKEIKRVGEHLFDEKLDEVKKTSPLDEILGEVEGKN
jgi:hypothetical protein